MKIVPSFVLSLLLTLVVTNVNAQNYSTLGAAGLFGSRGDGSIQPGDLLGTNPQNNNEVRIRAPGGFGIQPGDSTAAPISTNGYNMRGLSYDPITGNLLFVDTHAGQGGAQFMPPNSAIYVLD